MKITPPTTDQILTAGVLGLFGVFFFFLFIKWWFPFWSSQPVFHSYDVWRYFCIQPFFIHKQYRPPKKKNQQQQPTNPTQNNLMFPTETYHIKPLVVLKMQSISKKWLDCSPTQQNRLLDFIHCFHIPAENTLFYIPTAAFQSLFISSSLPPITTFTQEINPDIIRQQQQQQQNNPAVILQVGLGNVEKKVAIDFDVDDNVIINENKHNRMIGCLTSCSAQLQIQTPPQLFTNQTVFQQNIYQLHYLCIHPEKQEKEQRNLTHQLLQEHLDTQNRVFYTQHTHKNNNNQQQHTTTATFFWKEGEPCHGIVAFLTTPVFLLDFAIVKTLQKLPAFYSLTAATTHDDLDAVFHTITTTKQFTCSIYPNKAQTMSRMKAGLLQIYLLKFKGAVCGVYIFKDCFTVLDGGSRGEKHCLELQGCWLGNQYVVALSPSVVKLVVYEWAKQKKNDVVGGGGGINGQSVLVKINTTAHNELIINSCSSSLDIFVVKSHSCFGYFHNLFCHRMETAGCFIWG